MFLELTGLAFWGFCLAALILIIVCSALTEARDRHWGWVLTLLTASGVLLGYLHVFNLYNWVLSNPWNVGKLLIGYVVIALIWGISYWTLKCKRHKRKFLAAKTLFLEQHHVSEFTPTLRIEWTRIITEAKNQGSQYYNRWANLTTDRLEAKNYKETIISAMALWPFSILGTFVSDIIVQAWEHFYDFISGILDSISNKIFSGMKTDFATPEDLRKVEEEANARRASDK